MTRRVIIATLVMLAGGIAVPAASGQTPPPQTPPPAQTPKPVPALPVTQTPPPAVPVPFPADSKIAFINMQVLLAESKLGKSGLAEMKTLTDKQQADLQLKANAATLLQTKIQQQGSLVTPTALQQMNNDLEKAQRDLQYARNEAQAQADELNQKLLGDFQEKALPIIDALGKEKALYAVFSVQDSGVAYVHPGLDLTGEVIKRLDAKYPGK
jgi:outer membrane protein